MTNLVSAADDVASSSDADDWHARKPHVDIDSHVKSQLSVDVDVSGIRDNRQLLKAVNTVFEHRF
jgi:hypothetical protein